MGDLRRDEIVATAQTIGLPLVEDNPYGELWYDDAPPAPVASRWPEGTIYLESFSKVLAPGLRLGYVVAPTSVYSKLLQAKQAANLHTPGFNQRLVHAVIDKGFVMELVARIRAHYKRHRDAMEAALLAYLPDECPWALFGGGMFFWVPRASLPRHCFPVPWSSVSPSFPVPHFLRGPHEEHVASLASWPCHPSDRPRRQGLAHLIETVCKPNETSRATRRG